MPFDQPSQTMWCMVTRRTCSSSDCRTSDARKSGPVASDKRLARFLEDELLGAPGALGRGQCAQVDDVEPHRRVPPDDLHDVGTHAVEAGAEDLVADREVRERAFEGGDVERPRESERERHVERGIPGHELVELPVPLLRKRSR